MTDARLRLLLRANAVVGLAFGFGLLVLAGPLLELYGIVTTDATVAVARLLGAELLGFNVATWLAAETPSAWRPVVLGHVVNEALTAAVAVMAISTGVANGVLWSVVVLSGGFAVAYTAGLPRVRTEASG